MVKRVGFALLLALACSLVLAGFSILSTRPKQDLTSASPQSLGSDEMHSGSVSCVLSGNYTPDCQ
ncbi:MAG: hypothetical protein JW941_01175 [Candidatus Coatesbacteria bacterium]|nr:hypothetical protein [Candidatus Coatesbacteria bacterium]